MRTVIGIDPSTQGIACAFQTPKHIDYEVNGAWAWWEDELGGHRMIGNEYTCLWMPRKEKPVEYLEMLGNFAELFAMFSVHLAIEDCYACRNVKTSMQLAQVQRELTIWCDMHKLCYELVTPTTWQMWIGCERGWKRPERKRHSMAEALRVLGLSRISHAHRQDIADALHIARWAACEEGAAV